MTAYATADDLEAYWRAMTDEEKAKAETLLGYASVMVRARCGDDPDADAAKFVACDMAKTAMQSASDLGPITQMTMTGGPYSRTLQYANPSGDLYWKSQYDALLGLTGTALGSIGARTAFDE